MLSVASDTIRLISAPDLELTNRWITLTATVDHTASERATTSKLVINRLSCHDPVVARITAPLDPLFLSFYLASICLQLLNAINPGEQLFPSLVRQ